MQRGGPFQKRERFTGRHYASLQVLHLGLLDQQVVHFALERKTLVGIIVDPVGNPDCRSPLEFAEVVKFSG